MGIRLFSSGSEYCHCSTPRNTPPPPSRYATDPDPKLFTVKWVEQHGAYVIAMINYTNCTTYNGDKICVYKATVKQIKYNKYLDPHFLEDNQNLYPIARFPATDLGIHHARLFVDTL
jgi:hypothetical protein